MSNPSPWWKIWGPSLFRTLLIPLCAAGYLLVIAWQNYLLESSQPKFPEFRLPQVGSPDLYMTKESALPSARLVVFWATWCAPCKKQRDLLDPWIIEGSRQHQVLGVATLDAQEQVLAEEASHPHPFTSIMDKDGQLAEDLGIQALPVSLLVDQHGRVTRRFTGPLTLSDLRMVTEQLNR
jgi:thiol-disulfide isomerase/thioredoxin